jgi:non-ribosomal peptide synthetase component F
MRPSDGASPGRLSGDANDIYSSSRVPNVLDIRDGDAPPSAGALAARRTGRAFGNAAGISDAAGHRRWTEQRVFRLLGRILTRHARYRPNHLAVVFGTNRLTYAQFNAQVNRWANGLLFALGAKDANAPQRLPVDLHHASKGLVHLADEKR